MSESPSSIFKPGTVLEDKWIIIELIGKGAMGEVYRAHQRNLKRDVAIKIISQEVLAAIEEDPEELNIAFGRFQREVQAMAQVRHPNVLTIYDYGEIPNAEAAGKFHTAYIAMEYIPGNTLRFTMDEDGRDDDPELLATWISNYFLPLLNGVEVLHTHSIVHRDLKPENIFLDGEVPKIADFGLSRSSRMKALTCSVEMLGTLAYMSPEQCADFKNADLRTDIYALGKILYEGARGTLTENTLPFTAVSLDNPTNGFLKALNTVLLRATNEKPEGRYQSVQEFRSGIQEALAVFEGKIPILSSGGRMSETSARSGFSPLIGWTTAALAILAVAAMTVYHLMDSPKFVSGPSLSPSVHQKRSGYEPGGIELDSGEIPPPTIVGRDGSRMILTGISGGPEEEPLFYVDDKKISNFLFVEFLNHLGDAVTVNNGVVRLDEQIIFYIGSPPDETPIIYLHNTFHLSDQSKGTDPVVRVTYHGAFRYAATYGKSLLTGKEWHYTYRYHSSNLPANMADTQVADQSGGMPHMQASSILPGEGESEARSGQSPGWDLKEWVRVETKNSDEETEQTANAYASGVMDGQLARENKSPVRRQPWEGFDTVGFRTKLVVQQQ
ncbi:serine/threonine-protein kinase [Desulfofustis glycolicus]|uniref:Serine/threonine protein kinase n=1 Tax=Desulfofustis glycolicus DSM 9705 TaxID=1121409 RepID=A0A1M5V4G1_9BACT|nr:serine/threonine-protein kinase [Desulfofustis glycolicus]SHH70121.1 serine/threonine protein kinase [Desulfofustis glycolicus DSM 9705]